MRKPIDVILVGLGLVGREAARAVLGRRGMRLVGAVDADPGKIGRDVGDLLEIEGVGVRIEPEAGPLLARVRPDVALHVVSTTIEEAVDQIGPILGAGIDIVSSNEELGNAYAVKPGLAAALDAQAKGAGATVLGTGYTPGFSSDFLILALTAACRDVRRIVYRRVSDSRPYIGSVVAEHFGLGFTRQRFEEGVASGEVMGHVGFLESARTVSERLGWNVDRVTRDVVPAFTRTGTVVAATTTVRVWVGGEERLVLDLVSSIEDGVEGGDWYEIDATPPIRVEIKPQVSSVVATANAMVNAVPHVLNAPAGLMTPGDLPLVHALEGDARLMLADVRTGSRAR